MPPENTPQTMRRKTRASLSNAAGRFDMLREAVDYGWFQEVSETVIPTEVRQETARTLITYSGERVSRTSPTWLTRRCCRFSKRIFITYQLR
ncbi:hypothetical protein [Leisingera sp. ANG59]|uniref:hypothetical protein n=1 Tax=Leisingera sp. ANG59 TaxID=2675221 RepID=UPI001574AA91|nr:hypothetical protein [Leisingera sp. ANG59]